MASRDVWVDLDDQRDIFSTPGPYELDHPSSETSTGTRPESDQVLYVKRKVKKRAKPKAKSGRNRYLFSTYVVRTSGA